MFKEDGKSVLFRAVDEREARAKIVYSYDDESEYSSDSYNLGLLARQCSSLVRTGKVEEYDKGLGVFTTYKSPIAGIYLKHAEDNGLAILVDNTDFIVRSSQIGVEASKLKIEYIEAVNFDLTDSEVIAYVEKLSKQYSDIFKDRYSGVGLGVAGLNMETGNTTVVLFRKNPLRFADYADPESVLKIKAMIANILKEKGFKSRKELEAGLIAEYVTKNETTLQDKNLRRILLSALDDNAEALIRKSKTRFFSRN